MGFTDVEKIDVLDMPEATFTGLPVRNPEKMVVAKSRSLDNSKVLWKFFSKHGDAIANANKDRITLGAFKLFELYLARIHGDDPNKFIVRFSLTEFSKIMGIKRTKKEEIEPKILSLRELTLAVPDAGNHKNDPEDLSMGYTFFTFFHDCRVVPNLCGSYDVVLACSEEAKKYVFNQAGVGFFKYQFARIAGIKKLHTYFLFQYLASNNFRKEWTVGLDDLKRALGCYDNNGKLTYDQFKFFNQSVLIDGRNELIELSRDSETGEATIDFDYSLIRTGRKVSAIRFTINKGFGSAELTGKVHDAVDAGSRKAKSPEQISTKTHPFDLVETAPKENNTQKFTSNGTVPGFDPDKLPSSNIVVNYYDACIPDGGTECEFSYYEMSYIVDLIFQYPEESLPYVNPYFKYVDPANQRKALLHTLYLNFCRKAIDQAKKGNPVRDRASYFGSMIRQANVDAETKLMSEYAS